MARKLLIFLALALVLALSGAAGAGVINVDVYSGHSTSGGGTPYTGYVGSFLADDILFATNTGYAWHPFGLSAFGADITGALCVTADGTYSFTLSSDDGSMLYIDASLVVDNGGGHAPTIVSGSTFLTAGLHTFEVQFFEDFGGPSGVDLYLPCDVSFCAIPLPPSLLLLASGLASLMALGRRKLGG